MMPGRSWRSCARSWPRYRQADWPASSWRPTEGSARRCSKGPGVFTLDVNIFVQDMDSVARRHSCTMVTLNEDPHRRGGAVVTVLTPADALARMTPPESGSAA
jgi:hypothetical protein